MLTCAHNVYNNTKKLWAKSIQVYPAKQGNCAPFGKAEVTKAYVYEDWTKKGDQNFDIALLILNQSIGQSTGWGGICCIKDNHLSASIIHITGYPGDKGFGHMWTMDHKIQNASSEVFEYIVDTFGGQSGSAVWSNNFGHQPNILGVHTLGGASVNYGVRISQRKFTDLIAPFITNTYTKKSVVSLIGNLSLSSEVPEIAFGKAKWGKYFGDIGFEPPLPPNIEQILNSECIFWPGKKVRETHLLVLIPQTVNEEAFNINVLGEIIRDPKANGHKSNYARYTYKVLKEIGNQSVPRSYWALITKDVLPNSLGMSYPEKQDLIKHPYTVPKAIEVATGILMHHTQTGEKLYSKGVPNTRCEETLSDGYRAVVGCFDSTGLHVFNFTSGHRDTFRNPYYGISGVWKL